MNVHRLFRPLPAGLHLLGLRRGLAALLVGLAVFVAGAATARAEVRLEYSNAGTEGPWHQWTEAPTAVNQEVLIPGDVYAYVKYDASWVWYVVDGNDSLYAGSLPPSELDTPLRLSGWSAWIRWHDTTPGMTVSGTFPNDHEGQTFSREFLASGGVPPYTWTKSGTFAGSVTMTPSGTNNATMTATGTYPAEGEYSLTITAQDSETRSASKTFTLIIEAPYPNPTLAGTLPSGGNTAASSSTSWGANNGTPPYTWSVTGNAGGTFTPGIGTDGTSGLLNITWGEPGTYTLGLTVTDAHGKTASTSRSVTVTAPPLALYFDGIPDGTTGNAFTTGGTISGGTAPYTLSGGGLTYSITGTANGVTTFTASGTYGSVGSHNYTIAVTAAGDTATATGSYTVSEADPGGGGGGGGTTTGGTTTGGTTTGGTTTGGTTTGGTTTGGTTTGGTTTGGDYTGNGNGTYLETGGVGWWTNQVSNFGPTLHPYDGVVDWVATGHPNEPGDKWILVTAPEGVASGDGAAASVDGNGNIVPGRQSVMSGGSAAGARWITLPGMVTNGKWNGNNPGGNPYSWTPEGGLTIAQGMQGYGQLDTPNRLAAQTVGELRNLAYMFGANNESGIPASPLMYEIQAIEAATRKGDKLVYNAIATLNNNVLKYWTTNSATTQPTTQPSTQPATTQPSGWKSRTAENPHKLGTDYDWKKPSETNGKWTADPLTNSNPSTDQAIVFTVPAINIAHFHGQELSVTVDPSWFNGHLKEWLAAAMLAIAAFACARYIWAELERK